MEAELKAFKDFLRKKTLKLTTQRTVIAKRIFRTSGHFSAEDIVGAFRKDRKAISKSTVYRTLDLLVEGNLLEAIDFDRGYRLYERCHGRSHHDHLICMRCRLIVEFCNDEIESLQDQVAESHGFRTVWHTHKIFGLCSSCSDSVDANPSLGSRQLS